MINFLRCPPFKQLKVLQQYYDGLDTKRVVLRVDDGYCLQPRIHPLVQLRADELHLNSLRRAQHYISFAHHIIPDYISCSFYILPLYNSFSLHGTLHYSSFLFQIFLLHYNSGRREPQGATVYTFGPASICTAANRHVIIICQTEHVINQM